MNKIINHLNKLILILLLIVVAFSCSANNKKVVATVNSEEIYFEDFKNRYEDFLLSTGIKDTYPNRANILNSMITEVLLQKFDNNDSVLANSEYQREKKWVDQEAVLGYLIDREVFAKITASDKEIRTAFKRANMKVAARHLYAKTLDEANELYSLLQSGVSFDLLAKQVFSDSTLRNNGGYLGFFSWGDMDPAFEQVAFTLPIGEISKPVKTEEGYSIIKVEKRVEIPLLTEDEYLKKKEKIARLVRINKKKPSERKFIESLIDLNKIKIYDDVVKEIYDNYSFILKDESEVLPFEDLNEVTAEYNEKKMTLSETVKRLEALPYYHREKIKTLNNLKTVLKGFFLKDKLLELAKEKGYFDNHYVIKKRKQLETNLFMRYKMIYITKNSELSDSLLLNFYDSNKSYFSTKDQFRVSEIIVDRKSLADSLKNVLRHNPQSFAELASKFSLRKFSAVNGGNMGWAPIEKFGLLRKEIYHAKVNRLIGPVKIKNFYGIFKVTGKRKGEIPKFDQIKDNVKIAAKLFYRNDLFKKYQQKIFEKNNIKINLDVLKNTPILNYN
jgi:parvulin-like peptidyl-prolyl isomerase